MGKGKGRDTYSWRSVTSKLSFQQSKWKPQTSIEVGCRGTGGGKQGENRVESKKGFVKN